MTPRKQIFYIPLALAIFSLTLFFIAVLYAWLGPAAGSGDAFCESSREGLIKQPANTWSNIMFVYIGLLIAWQLAHNKFAAKQNTITKSVFFGTFFACIVVLLGPGSMAMHATEAKLGGYFDMLAMYLVVSFTMAYALQRFFNLTSLHFFLVFCAVLISCLFIQELPYKVFLINNMGNFIFAFYILFTVIIEFLNGYVRKLHQEKKYGYFSIITLILAFIIWNLWKDDSIFCNPQSLIQGHAMWHFLDAIAAYFLFRYYASEEQGLV